MGSLPAGREAAPGPVKMIGLPKTHGASWRKGKEEPGPSKLDHAFAAEHLRFKRFEGQPIKVVGWSEVTDEVERRRWNEDFSDHARCSGRSSPAHGLSRVPNCRYLLTAVR